MAVYDRWHKAPAGGDQPCREHSRGRARMYPSAAHGTGRRWQVRWYDDQGRQKKRNFRLKEGGLPSVHADAFDAKIRRDLDTGGYTDPSAGDVTFRAYAEDWRRTRSHDTSTAEGLERRLRLHAYEDPADPGRTRRGGVAIGQRKLAELARRPSLLQAWIAGLPLKPSTAAVVFGDVAAVLAAAADDGIIPRDPSRAASVRRPRPGTVKARPWTREQVEAMAGALPARCQVIPWLGAGTGMRQGEMFGLAVEDIAFLGKDPHITVTRQVKLVGNAPRFAPLKNRKSHRVPLPGSLAARLARHLELYPAVTVTLPWHDLKDPARHGQPVTARLVLTDARGRPWARQAFNSLAWRPARRLAGIGGGRDDGCHVLRHTAASAWLRAGIDVVRVAAWLGDTPAVVLRAYAHLMPGESGEAGRAAADAFLGDGGQRAAGS